VKHTYIFEEGIWSASGEFTDENGMTLPATAETRTTYHADMWIHEGTMRLAQSDGFEVMNRYEITPPMPGSTVLRWVSYNPALGKLSGYFAVVADAILSSYSSEDGTFTGLEYLVQLTPDRYTNRGILMQDERRISSWAMDISRVRDNDKGETNDQS
jgi:hypothetical protein